MNRTVLAAGGVLWRGDLAAPQVALVHRPEHDDWSLPKGKAKPSEHLLVTALREVTEETGISPRLGPFLTTVRFRSTAAHRAPVTKEVSYWSMRAGEGDFVPSDEVDEMRWLDVEEARAASTSALDRVVLDAFVGLTHDTTPLVLVRHGDLAAARLSPAGRAQARALVPVLRGLGIETLVSAELPGCLETLGPFADTAGLPVRNTRGLDGVQDAQDLEEVADDVRRRATHGCATAVCTQQETITRLLRALAPDRAARAESDPGLKAAGWWLLHMADDQVRACEKHESAA